MDVIYCIDLEEYCNVYENACMSCGMEIEDEYFVESHKDIL